MELDGRIIYYPWSNHTQEECQKIMLHGGVPILELELSAICIFKLKHGGCKYCDSKTGSPHPNEISFELIERNIHTLKNHGLKWIFICGLGEPFDDEKFWKLIRLTKQLKIKTSIFTNGLLLGLNNRSMEGIINELYDNWVSMIVKCDGLDIALFAENIGLKEKEILNRNQEFIRKAIEIGYGSSKETDLALSIVPTKINLHGIPKIIQFCKENKIFPLIGELENAGGAKEIYNEIVPPNKDLKQLLLQVDELWGYPYEVPVCPASIYSLHTNNKGAITVDSFTGLSCPWFHLKNPVLKELGYTGDEDPKHIMNRILAYREEHLDNVKKLHKPLNDAVFGGCGGKRILDEYENFLRLFNRTRQIHGPNLEQMIFDAKNDITEDEFQRSIINYNQIAREYAISFAEIDYEKTNMLRFIDYLKNNATILDAGCGTGRWFDFFLDRGLSIEGMDISKEIIIEAQKKSPRVSSYISDVRNLQIQNKQFDGILASYLLCYIPRRDLCKTLTVFFNLLNERGHLYLTLYEGDGIRYFHEPLDHTGKYGFYIVYYKYNEIRNYLKKNGFDIVWRKIEPATRFDDPIIQTNVISIIACVDKNNKRI